MTAEISLALMGTGLGLGLRHGVDWDHIAAISGVTCHQPSSRRAYLMGTIYALGHAAVVVALGLTAIWLGALLPVAVDGVMEILVGVTLVLLGAWVMLSLAFRRQFALKSRWMVLNHLVRLGIRKILDRHHADRTSENSSEASGPRASAAIGMIHGIGAETGTQALLLASVAGATSTAAGSFVLIFFVLGLFVSNAAITVASITGFIGAGASRAVQTGLSAVIGVLSLVLGMIYLTGSSDVLPGIIS